ncbi:MAG TPA: hypothetical protein VNQ77_03865 [Frankiaceae bacterium]|nr:hypothetical protein [Frankiaceae bacterium]
MRIRTLVAAFGAATLLVGLGAAPASAGDGPSEYCGDGIPSSGHVEVPLVNTPVTLGLEVVYSPAGQVHICYSTTPYGQPGGIGGEIAILAGTDSANPSVTAYVVCVQDAPVIVGTQVLCWEGASVDLGDVTIGTPGSGLCLSYQGVCLVEVPLVSVAGHPDPNRHLISLYVLGQWHHIDLA